MRPCRDADEFEPAAERPSETIALWLDGHRSRCASDADRLLARPAADDTRAAMVKTDPATLAAVLWHGLGIDRAVAEGRSGASRATSCSRGRC